jgi:hypothetical protein
MTIELNRKDSQWIYRINPFSPTCIDRRANRSAARWYWYARRATPEDALKYLLELEKQNKEPSR